MVYVISAKDIYWAAGLIEGEGCFCAQHGTNPEIRVKMCDQDIIERLHTLLGSPQKIYTYTPKGKPTYKPMYCSTTIGHRAVSWMMMVYPIMGRRRQAKIRELLQIALSGLRQLL
jgi:hypothetical protein